MPRFTRNQKPLSSSSSKRTFSRSSKRRSKPASVDVVKTNKTTSPPPETTQKTQTLTSEAFNKTTSSHGDTPTNSTPTSTPNKATPTKKQMQDSSFNVDLAEVERLIESASDELSTKSSSEVVGYASRQTDPDTFDGLSSVDEQITLLAEQLKEERRATSKLKHEISLIKTEFEQEKKTLEKHIKELKKELHRSAPLHDTKLFSLSKELRGAIDAIEQLAGDDEFAVTEETVTAAADIRPPQTLPPKEDMPSIVSSPTPTDQKPEKIYPAEAATSPSKPEKTNESTKETNVVDSEPKPGNTKQSKKKKKVAAMGAGAAVALVFLFGGLYQFMSAPSVDDDLVNAYLEESSGDVMGVASAPEISGVPQQTNTPTEYSDNQLLNQEVLFDETIWENFGDPVIGINVQYPTNATKVIKTESSATFSRKDGYIFKVQRIETELTLTEYWDQIRSTTLNYISEEVNWKNREVLQLTLDDATDFPGNRYLVPLEGAIIDVWYAIEGGTFSEDDLKRAEYMLQTISFRK